MIILLLMKMVMSFLSLKILKNIFHINNIAANESLKEP